MNRTAQIKHPQTRLSVTRFRVTVRCTVHIVHWHIWIYAALALPLLATSNTACPQDCSVGISTPRRSHRFSHLCLPIKAKATMMCT